MKEFDENSIIFDPKKIWDLEIDTKNISWNGNSTKKISQIGIAYQKIGKAINIKSYQEVLNNLLEQFNLNLNSPKSHVGRKGINIELFNLMTGKEDYPIAAKNFLKSKMRLEPVTFLEVVKVISYYTSYCSRVYKKNVRTLKRTELGDPETLKDVLSELTAKSDKFYLVNFYNYITPFNKMKTTFEGEKRFTFDHPVIENHCKYKLDNGTTPSSVTIYRSNIKSFFKWSCSVLKDFEDATPETIDVYKFTKEHVEEYRLFLESEVRRNNRTPNGAKQHFIYIKGFFSYLYSLGFLVSDFTEEIPNIKASAFVPRKLPSNKQLQLFFDTVSVYSDDPEKEQLAFLLMLCLGLRKNEVAHIRWEDFNLGNKILSIKGKNRKTELLPVPDDLFELLHRFSNNKTGFLFSEKPREFQRKIYKNFKIYKLLSGLDFGDGVHLLRHIYITKLSHMCLPNVLQVLARQKSERSVSFYVHRYDEELTQAINKPFFTED